MRRWVLIDRVGDPKGGIGGDSGTFGAVEEVFSRFYWGGGVGYYCR